MPYVPGRKAAAQLGIHQNTLRRYADEEQIRVIRTKSGQRRYDVDAYLGESADAALVCYCRVSSTKQRKDLQRQIAFMRERYPEAEIVQNIGGGLNWSDFTAAISSELWLPIETGSPDSGSSLFSGLLSKTAVESWFSTTRTTAPKRNSRRIFSPSSTPSLADFTACVATATQSRRIRGYPTREQHRILRRWFNAARWCYNETVAQLRADPELKANWKVLKTEIIHAIPELLKDTPYQVRSIGVRDACRAMSEVKRRNKELGPGLPGGEYHELRFRSRKAPKQGCFVPATAVSEYGTYHTLLGRLRMAERLPRDHGDSQLTLHNGQYHLSGTMPARRRVGETQACVVALDPGIRSFLTWFSETDAGHIAPGAFGKIQRLCAYLDALLSRAKLEKQRFPKRNKYRAAAHMRVRISNLIDELHYQTAR